MNEFNSTSVFNNRGFTLIEILIAIVLLAFITLGVVNITEDAAQTMERTTEINRNNLQIETALSRFEWDFSQIYSPLYFSTVMNLNQLAGSTPLGGPDGEAPPDQDMALQINPALQNYFEQLVNRFERNEHFSSVSKEGLPVPRFYAPEKNVFEFFTTSNRRKIENTKQSHFAWVRYALAEQVNDPDEEENPNVPKSLKSLVRYFAPNDPYNDKRINPDDSQVKGAVLLRNVEKLEFEYWDYSKRKWETSLTSIPGGESVIRGVRVSITWYDSSGFERSVSRIFRNHWPMIVPQDQTTPAVAQPTGGATSGDTGADDDDI
jgi:prepilin-type N-terminal cleavage/methylation domain-containing protein